MTPRSLAPSLVAAVALGSAPVWAQAPGPADPSAPPQGSPTGAPAAPAAPPNTVITRGPAGSFVISPAEPDPNQSLPSSSRPKTGDQSDSFDMNVSKGGPVVVGNPGGQAILPEGGGEIRRSIPPIHLVRHGDTLWDLSDNYYGNPWQWPKIWGMNPQVTNPHWIYPGDQLRMLPGDGSGASVFDRFARGGQGNGAGGGGGPGGAGRGQRLVKDTIVLRDQGYLGDPKDNTWGEVAGAVEEQMLLSEGNHVFLMLKPEKTARPGESLTVFRSVRTPEDVEGARKPPGEIVQVLGTVKIDRVDPKTHVARGTIVESLDIIERGAKVGPVRRSFNVVPPLKAQKDISAHVLSSFYPHVYFGQNQVVFLDRGTDDGLQAGNRLVVLRRGDTWRASLGSKMGRDRMRLDSPDQVQVERTPLPGDNEDFPEEAVAELRVLTAERFSSLALVSQARRELVAGDIATTRAGF